MVNLIYYIYL